MQGVETTRQRLAEIQRATLNRMCEVTGLAPTRLATDVGIAPSTINRRLMPGDHGLISVDIWHRLSAKTGVPVPAEILNAAPTAATEIDPKMLERALCLCFAVWRARDPEGRARELGRPTAYAYQAFRDAEASGRPIDDNRVALKMLRDTIASMRRGRS
jgi:hypothetical protein